MKCTAQGRTYRGCMGSHCDPAPWGYQEVHTASLYAWIGERRGQGHTEEPILHVANEFPLLLCSLPHTFSSCRSEMEYIGSSKCCSCHLPIVIQLPWAPVCCLLAPIVPTVLLGFLVLPFACCYRESVRMES